MIEKEDKGMEELSNEEEILMDLYEKETGKNPITARKTLRKEYLKWKSEALQLEQELIKGIIKEKQEEQELIKEEQELIKEIKEIKKTWKSEGLQEEPTKEIPKEKKEIKKTGNLKNWLRKKV